ncbi:MAG: hypothetical protein Kow0037_19580 [Calditrichia bacterium]
MKQVFFVLLIATFGVLLWSCQPKVVVKEVKTVKPEPKVEMRLPDTLYVEVSRENVRQSPNGRALGVMTEDEMVITDRRVGNWIQFHNSRFDSAYIWAPSLGLEYINLYSPATYYDPVKRDFKSVAYFRMLFGSKGEIMEEVPGEKALFFDELGLGSHEDVVVQVVAGSKVVVKHGVRLALSNDGLQIVRVGVDFYKPIKGFKKAVKQCQLPKSEPNEVNEGRIIWNSPAEFPGLRIVLERKEWKSDWFTQVVFEKSAEE